MIAEDSRAQVNPELPFDCTPHKKYFYEDGSIALRTKDNVVFHVHHTLIVERIAPLAHFAGTKLCTSDDAGTLKNPFEFATYSSEQIETYLDLIYDCNAFLKSEKKDLKYYLTILELADVWFWDEARSYAIAAINALRYRDIDPYIKLLIGVRYKEEVLVFGALKLIYFSGPCIEQPTIGPEYDDYIPESRQTMTWILHEGSQLLERVILELISTAPCFDDTEDNTWQDHKCSDHAVCVQAVKSQWVWVVRDLSSEFKRTNGPWTHVAG
ncbi:hypothetical protein K435DRAFT_865564 [Dendrothele bispora CBS 962.96]|uniref:BTB domain-containing protein n=1 Tax=Dendrothele bispora (strain CBS 962.96) TaxID=1314807 RepID=A0A4S8LKI9_DENBC|nr:hypothetical protein K435DRAFT_865564 [Dendrothele bispora CBS 962.96]